MSRVSSHETTCEIIYIDIYIFNVHGLCCHYESEAAVPFGLWFPSLQSKYLINLAVVFIMVIPVYKAILIPDYDDGL